MSNENSVQDMTTECLICFNPINRKFDNKTYIFAQTCNCYYNVHDECLVEWVNKYKKCIICHKQLNYEMLHKPFKDDAKNKKNTIISNLFKCCIIL
jgi:hypothetical protein